MKVIDLLIKLSNNENYQPKKIKFNDDIFVWDNYQKDWFNEYNIGLLEYNVPVSMNNEIEIVGDTNVKD